MIAALFVEPTGSYAGLEGVELWDEKRDARTYAGPWPVIAHPPCARWCRLAGFVEARWGHRRGDDGGCFESALRSVRAYGGVLEHPAYTDAFAAYGIPAPGYGGWQRTIDGAWVCHVEQGRYGHRAKKATWLYYVGEAEPPALDFGVIPDAETGYDVGWTNTRHSEHRIKRSEALATPQPFRDVLIQIARGAGEVMYE